MIFSIINCFSFHGSVLLRSTIIGLLKTSTTNISTSSSLKWFQEHLLILIFAKTVLSCKCRPSVTDNMYKNVVEITQNSSAWNTRVVTTQLQVRWCEMTYRHFQISTEMSVICVHSKRAIFCSRYIGWETDIRCLYIRFIQIEVKMKPFRYWVNSQTSYPGLPS